MGTPWGGAEQVAPQPPQFLGSEASRTHWPSQSTLPSSQPSAALAPAVLALAALASAALASGTQISVASSHR